MHVFWTYRNRTHDQYVLIDKQTKAAISNITYSLKEIAWHIGRVVRVGQERKHAVRIYFYVSCARKPKNICICYSCFQVRITKFHFPLPILRAYDSSRTYRELRIRYPLLENRKLALLPKEQQYDELDGVWNLTTDQANDSRSFIRIPYLVNRVTWENSTLPTFALCGIPLCHTTLTSAFHFYKL